MKPDRWQQIDKLFEADLEREPRERAAFLDQACGDDQQLRREVEKLLRIDEQATDFIQSNVFNVAANLITKPSDGPSGRPTRKSLSSDSIDDARFIPGDI